MFLSPKMIGCLMKKILILILISLSFSVNAEELFKKPVATCGNIKSFGSYKLASELISKCKKYGVEIGFKKAKNKFESMLTKDDLSSSECRSNCLVLKTFSQTEMNSCVENDLVNPFVEGFMSSLAFNKANCNNMKNMIDQ